MRLNKLSSGASDRVLSKSGCAAAERQLILLSAGTVARRQTMRERARELMADIEWSQLAQTLRERTLLTALGPRIVEFAANGASEGFAAEVEEAVSLGRRHGVYLQLVSDQVMAMLADAGICVTTVKGPALAEAIYGDIGRRLSGDIDLLVAPEQLLAAVDVVRELGYSAPADHVERRGLPTLHFRLVHAQEALPTIELHWRVHWYEPRFARQRLLPPADGCATGWRPAPCDELAALLLFYARDGFVDLRLAADLSAWWDVFGHSLSPGALGGLLRSYPELGRVLRVAVRVADLLVGLPTRQIIGDMPSPSLRECVAVRMADPHPRASSPQLFADIALIDGLLAPPGGFGAFVSRQILPPRDALGEYAALTRMGRANSRFGHAARVLSRFALAMIRLVRRPER